jgi:hypothetical protein
MTKNLRVDAAIVVPWRMTPEREYSFNLAWKYNGPTFSDFKVYFSDSVGERFNVSEARNRGCIQAIEDGFRLLIVMDADTIFERDAIVDALKVVSEQEVISYIYTKSMEPYLDICEGLDEGEIQPHEIEERLTNCSVGHIGSGWAMSSEMFWKMNGWDENFVGWGYEDTALNEAYEILHGSPMLRVSGNCYRLFHSERDNKDFDKNTNRFQTHYSNPKATPESIRDLISHNMVHLIKP